MHIECRTSCHKYIEMNFKTAETEKGGHECVYLFELPGIHWQWRLTPVADIFKIENNNAKTPIAKHFIVSIQSN